MFNKETEYALRGLVYIQLQNTNGRRPGIVEIAKEIEAPLQRSERQIQLRHRFKHRHEFSKTTCGGESRYRLVGAQGWNRR